MAVTKYRSSPQGQQPNGEPSSLPARPLDTSPAPWTDLTLLPKAHIQTIPGFSPFSVQTLPPVLVQALMTTQLGNGSHLFGL